MLPLRRTTEEDLTRERIEVATAIYCSPWANESSITTNRVEWAVDEANRLIQRAMDLNRRADTIQQTYGPEWAAVANRLIQRAMEREISPEETE